MKDIVWDAKTLVLPVGELGPLDGGPPLSVVRLGSDVIVSSFRLVPVVFVGGTFELGPLDGRPPLSEVRLGSDVIGGSFRLVPVKFVGGSFETSPAGWVG